MVTTLGLTDEQLAILVRQQNKNLYAEIIKRYEAKLRRYAAALAGNNHDAQDIVQEAFIKAYINLNGFNAKKKFSSWLYRIVHNEAVNFMKKNKSPLSLPENWDIDSGIDIEEDLIKKELKFHARQCLKQLTFKYKEVLSLYYLEEKSYEEISDILRLPPGTVAIRLKRAKISMKKICQK